MPAHPHTGPGAEGGGGWPMHATAQPWHAEGRPSADRSPAAVAQPQGTSRNSTSSTPRWVPWILTRPALAARSMPGRSLRTCSALASTRTQPPVMKSSLPVSKDLQPAVLVAVALVVQASTGGVGSLCPDLIHHQLPDRQWVPCRGVNGLTVEHQRVARVLTVVRDDQSVAHERVLLSPFLSRDHAAWVNPAMVLVSLAADQLSAPTSTGSAVSPEPSVPGLKQVPRQSGASNSVHPSQTVNDGIKDGTDGGTHRPKSSHSSRSGPLHTDTLSVAFLCAKGGMQGRVPTVRHAAWRKSSPFPWLPVCVC